MTIKSNAVFYSFFSNAIPVSLMGGGGEYSEGFSFSARNVDASSKNESDSPYNFKCVKCHTMPLETNLQSIKYSLKTMNSLKEVSNILVHD